jgi:hypothetical protein
MQFADLLEFQELTFGNVGGLSMGTTKVEDCAAKYMRTEGGIEMRIEMIEVLR